MCRCVSVVFQSFNHNLAKGITWRQALNLDTQVQIPSTTQRAYQQSKTTAKQINNRNTVSEAAS